jgi:hypothetical protein
VIEPDAGAALHRSEILYLIGLMVGVQMKRKDPPIERRNVNVAVAAHCQMS